MNVCTSEKVERSDKMSHYALLAGGDTYNQFYKSKKPLNVIKNVVMTRHRPGAVVGVLHVGHTDGGVADPVVDHRVH